jgi:hypothetical protein
LSIPVGVTTATVVFGKDVDFAGGPASVTAKVVPSHTVIWAATGERLVSFDIDSEAAEGVTGSFQLPHTDQAGFVDTAGNTITNWWYTVTAVSTRGRQSKASRRVLQPVTGQTTIDLELIPEDGSVLPVGTVPAPAVTSVNGQTGAVVIETGGGGGGSVDTVLVVTGTEERPDAELVIWIDPDDLGAVNAGANDLVVNPSEAATVESLIDAKGDLLVGSAADTLTRLAVGADGTVLEADSTAPGGVKWAAPSGGGGGGTVVDLYPRRPGSLYTTTCSLDTINADAPVFGTSGQMVWLTPFAVTHEQDIDRLAQNIAATGGAGSLVWMGVYPHDSAWGTVNRVAHASVTGDESGDKWGTVAATLTPGMYWLAIGTTDTAGTLRVQRASGRNNETTPFGTPSPGVDSHYGMRFDGVSLASGLPATLNLSAYAATARSDVPLVWVRVA